MSKHTKGPWIACHPTYTRAGICRVELARPSKETPQYMTIAHAETYSRNGAQAEADAARIVACVNALEGIEDPSVVPEMLEMLTRLSAATGPAYDKDLEDRLVELKHLLARAEGRK